MRVSPILPSTVTNEYRGTRVAIAFFGLLTAVSIARSLVHIIAADGGAQSIATIPLSSFGDAAAAAVVHVFALWGLSQLVVGVLSLVVLVRYRSLIPLFYLIALFEYTIRLVLTLAKPVEVTHAAPGAIGNYVMVPLLLAMFVLSLVRGRDAEQEP